MITLTETSAGHGTNSVIPSRVKMRERLLKQYGNLSQHGWRVKQKWRFRYVSPELWYEAVVDGLVNHDTIWLDVGGGKAVFPGNQQLSKTLADRCKKLVGVDPSDNIHLNEFVDERFQGMIEDYTTDQRFDLATFRMVAEHIQDPKAVVAKLQSIMKPGGKVVIYTPCRWSVSSAIASVTPHRVHTSFAKLLWRAQENDVFPTAYKMNTRGQLRRVFHGSGFRERSFGHFGDCSILQRFFALYPLELCVWRLWTMTGLRYPENNLLGVYEKLAD